MNQLICDCGGTKASWMVIDGEGAQLASFTTQGMNPAVNDHGDIAGIMSSAATQFAGYGVGRVWFYGAGCTPAVTGTMQRLLFDATGCRDIAVASDMLGAARALCGHGEGIACILGTGANSCYYDGREIRQNTPSLGYILGDEGGGATLGRLLINRLYKGIFPAELKELFEAEMKTDLDTIIENVYRRPMANRYLASFTYFMAAHRDNPHIQSLLQHCFGQFFRRNIRPYGRPDLQVSFVGSLADVFTGELSAAATAEGFTIGRIVRSPIVELAQFHAKCGQN